MAIDPSRVLRFGHGSRVPGWDDAADLEKDPATIPDLATTPVPEELRARIEDYMSRYPDRRSAAIPVLHAVQERYGWCSPEGIDQAAAVMRVTPGYLVSVATFYDMLFTKPVGEHAGDDPEFNIRAFECLGACDMAPMASIDGDYVGPIGLDEVPGVLEAVRRGEEPLPDRQLKRRRSVDPNAA